MFTAKCSLTPRKDTYPFISPSRFKSSLSGQVAIVTGAGRSIGRATALALADAGASVCLVARRKADIDAVAAEINGKAITVPADVADRDAAASIVSEAEKLGPVSILVNNAGVTRFNAFELESLPVDDWWRVMEVNLLGPVNLTRAVLPLMLERRQGTIISTTSTSGSQDIPFNTAYATSKAALIKFHQDLDVEVRDKGLRTFSIHPGSVQTDLQTSKGAVNMEAFERYPKMQEMFTAFQDYVHETPELAANTVLALCAEKRLAVLSGRYIDSQFDLEEVVLEAERSDRLDRENLYRLKLEEL